MRTERWYWLLFFCCIALMIQLSVGWVSRGYHLGALGIPKAKALEVALEPLSEPKKPDPAPEPKKPDPKPEPKAVPVPVHKPAPKARPVVVARNVEKPVEKPAPKPAEPIVPKAEKPAAPKVDPNAAALEAMKKIESEKPLPSGLPTMPKENAPRLTRANTPKLPVGGGGAPSPAPTPGGHDGFKAPEAPPEDVVYHNGGAGGEKLPAVAPIVGGGKTSILSVPNLLAGTVPEEKPGLGAGNGGGVGYATGKGIGTQANGGVALGTLHRKPGPGIGAATGSGIGTHPPGGGRGTGAELPGTGGLGQGYGRGKGIGLGDGDGEGVGNGPGTDNRIGRMRGIPFGDVAGNLRGDPGGGGSGPGGLARGGVFTGKPGGGGGGPVHIVYALDVSGSMRDGNKIGKAKEALKTALSELKATDTFNIIMFKRDVDVFAPDSVPATLVNKTNAIAYVDNVPIGNGTNISRAMDAALNMNGITHIYLMSDGEPNGGIQDFYQLRQFVKEKNTKNVKILTLALGLGEQFPGIVLLKGIAEDNGGNFRYINMAKINNPGQ